MEIQRKFTKRAADTLITGVSDSQSFFMLQHTFNAFKIWKKDLEKYFEFSIVQYLI